MKPSVIVLAALALAAPAARAQPQPATNLEPFLEQRVTEELAGDGIVLSRLGVSLDIELVGDRVLVSLVDLTTRRPIASTKLDALPANREAAVAVVTQTAANLTSQIGGRPPLPSIEPPRPAPPAPAPVVDDAETARREQAELRLRREAIGFGSDLFISGDEHGISTLRRWYAHQGELKARLDAEDFYKLVGRPDLADQYTQRRNIRIGAGIVGIGALVATSYTLYKFFNTRFGYLEDSNCDPFDDVCRDRAKVTAADDARPYGYATIALTAASITGMALYTYYTYKPHPISESEAKGLAVQHNDRLRHDLGLPSARHTPRKPSSLQWAIAPAPSGASFALSGRF